MTFKSIESYTTQIKMLYLHKWIKTMLCLSILQTVCPLAWGVQNACERHHQLYDTLQINIEFHIRTVDANICVIFP